jgi:hypothetical protein
MPMVVASMIFRTCFSLITLMPLRVRKAGLAGGDRDDPGDLAVAVDGHPEPVHVHDADHRGADPELDRPLLGTPDASAGLDVLQLHVDGDLGAAGQYSRGRKCSSLSLSQVQEPSMSLEVVTVSPLSTAARSFTGSLRRTTIGMPTPTVWPFRGEMLVVSGAWA